jgi:hypothetical protein
MPVLILPIHLPGEVKYAVLTVECCLSDNLRLLGHIFLRSMCNPFHLSM